VAAGIPVSYQEHGWLKHLFRILGALALTGGIILAAFVPDGAIPGAILAVLAVTLLAGSEFYFARQRAAQRFVIDTGRGFRWLGGPTEMEVPDSDVIAVRVKRTWNYSAGNLKAVIRRFEVWTAAGDKPMCMTNRMAGHEADPLAELMYRLIDDLKQRSAAGLAGGAALEGDGWRLADMQLTVVGRGKSICLPFAEIDMDGVYDGKLCLWRRGEDEPAAKIDPDSKNADVLASLLGDWIEHQRAASDGQPGASPSASGLGRLLFERRSIGGLPKYFTYPVHAAMLAVAIVFGHHLVYPVAVAVGIFERVFGHFRMRCYESGVGRRWGPGEFCLRFDEISEFTCAAKKILESYIQLSMTFQAARGTIRFVGTVQNLDADLDGLRDRVAKVMAFRILCQLRDGIAVPWVGENVLLPEGLQFRRPAMFGLAAGAIEILPYEQIGDVQIEKDTFYLYGKSQGRPLTKIPAGSVNFYPGYFAVLALMEGR
jgi:hypothetical protein